MDTRFEYDQLRDDHDLERLGLAQTTAFNASPSWHAEWVAKAGSDHLRVVRSQGSTVGGLLLVPMGQFFGGRCIPLTGIAGVAVLPEARGRGSARFLMRAALQELRAAGPPLSALYASTIPLYRSVGYELAGTRFRAKTQLAQLTRIPRNSRRVRPATPDDHATIEELYRARARHINGALDRGPYIWNQLREPPVHRVGGYLIESETETGTEPTGFVWLLSPAPGSSTEDLILADWGALDSESLQAILRFLGEHGTLSKRLSWLTGPFDSIRASLPSGEVELELTHDWLSRLVHVPAALEARGYARALDTELHLDVTDETLEENTGRWLVSIEDGRASVRQGGEGRLRADVGALASLYTGFATAEQLALTGRLRGDAEVLARASAIFAGPAPAMQDYF